MENTGMYYALVLIVSCLKCAIAQGGGTGPDGSMEIWEVVLISFSVIIGVAGIIIGVIFTVNYCTYIPDKTLEGGDEEKGGEAGGGSDGGDDEESEEDEEESDDDEDGDDEDGDDDGEKEDGEKEDAEEEEESDEENDTEKSERKRLPTDV